MKGKKTSVNKGQDGVERKMTHLRKTRRGERVPKRKDEQEAGFTKFWKRGRHPKKKNSRS